jgi:antitoxin VapB
MERRVKLQKDAESLFVVIPPDFELPSDDVIIRKVGDRLIIEPARKKESLLELLDRLEPLDEDFPEIEDPPPKPVDF